MSRLTLKMSAPVAVMGILGAIAANAQQQAPGAAPRAPAATPKPDYVVPPENSAGFYPVNGEPIFKEHCASCHEPNVDRAPTRQQLGARSAEEVFDALRRKWGVRRETGKE